MLEKLHHRIPEYWKTKLALLAERLILAEPQLRLTDDMDGDAIRREVNVYVKRCVRWQAKERQAMQARRDRAQSKWGQKPEHRPTWVLFLGFIGLAFLVCVLFWAEWQLSANLKFWEASIAKWAEPSALLGALAGAPVAFMIWRYRDQNTLWQIENQRKDINLKDFQKLTEWASGQHLQEDKVIEQTKRTEKGAEKNTEVTTETVTTREGSDPPNHARSVNKRTGGESLQVAAVYQLQAFLDGEFGQHFQRPAFQLLKSLWEGLVREHVGTLDAILEVENDTNDQQLSRWRQGLETLKTTPLGLILNESLATGAGRHLHLHPQDIPGAMLAGLSTGKPGLEPWALAGFHLEGIQLQSVNLRANLSAWLYGTEMRRANLQGVHLKKAKLQKANLEGANLQGAELEWANLHAADLNEARLQGSRLVGAKLKEASLIRAKLQGANLVKVDFRGANLEQINLRMADLQRVTLHGANLQGGKLQGADLRGVSIDANTNLTRAIYDAKTQFGQLKEDGASWRDEDWINAEAEEQRWRALGARRVDEKPTR